MTVMQLISELSGYRGDQEVVVFPGPAVTANERYHLVGRTNRGSGSRSTLRKRQGSVKSSWF